MCNKLIYKIKTFLTVLPISLFRRPLSLWNNRKRLPESSHFNLKINDTTFFLCLMSLYTEKTFLTVLSTSLFCRLLSGLGILCNSCKRLLDPFYI